MSEVNTTINLTASDTGLTATIDKVAAKTTDLTVKTTGLALAFSGLEKATRSSAAAYALGTESATKLADSLNKLTNVNSKVLKVFSNASNWAFYAQQVNTATQAIRQAGLELARVPQAFELMAKSGVTTAPVSDFYQLTEAIQGSGSAVDDFVSTAVAKLSQFEAASRRVGTILRSATDFDAASGIAKRASVQDLAANQTQVQDLVTKKLSNTVSSTEALLGQYEVLSGGFVKSADSQKVLEAGLKLTGIGSAGGVAADAGETLRLLTKTLRAYELGAGDAARTAGILNAVVENGITTVQELSANFGQAGSTAKQAGIAIEDLGGATAVLTAQGTNTSVALTGIQALARTIIDKTPEAAKALSKLKDEQGQAIRFDIAEVQRKGLVNALKDLNKATGGSPSVLAEILPDSLAFRTATALLANEGETFAGVVDSIKNTTVAGFDEVFEGAKGDRISQFEKIANRFQELIIQIGQSVAPVFEPGIAVLEKLASFFVGLPEPVKQAIGAFLVAKVQFAAMGSATGILVDALKKLAANYLIVRATSLLLSGQMGKEISVVRQLLIEKQGLFAAGLQIFGVDQKWRLSVNQTTGALQKQGVATSLLGRIQQKAFGALGDSARAAGSAAIGIVGRNSDIARELGLTAELAKNKFAQFSSAVQKTTIAQTMRSQTAEFLRTNTALQTLTATAKEYANLIARPVSAAPTPAAPVTPPVSPAASVAPPLTVIGDGLPADPAEKLRIERRRQRALARQQKALAVAEAGKLEAIAPPVSQAHVAVSLLGADGKPLNQARPIEQILRTDRPIQKAVELVDPRTGKPIGQAGTGELLLPGKSAGTAQPLILPGSSSMPKKEIVIPGSTTPAGQLIIPSSAQTAAATKAAQAESAALAAANSASKKSIEAEIAALNQLAVAKKTGYGASFVEKSKEVQALANVDAQYQQTVRRSRTLFGQEQILRAKHVAQELAENGKQYAAALKKDAELLWSSVARPKAEQIAESAKQYASQFQVASAKQMRLERRKQKSQQKAFAEVVPDEFQSVVARSPQVPVEVSLLDANGRPLKGDRPVEEILRTDVPVQKSVELVDPRTGRPFGQAGIQQSVQLVDPKTGRPFGQDATAKLILPGTEQATPKQIVIPGTPQPDASKQILAPGGEAFAVSQIPTNRADTKVVQQEISDLDKLAAARKKTYDTPFINTEAELRALVARDKGYAESSQKVQALLAREQIAQKEIGDAAKAASAAREKAAKLSIESEAARAKAIDASFREETAPQEQVRLQEEAIKKQIAAEEALAKVRDAEESQRSKVAEARKIEAERIESQTNLLGIEKQLAADLAPAAKLSAEARRLNTAAIAAQKKAIRSKTEADRLEAISTAQSQAALEAKSKLQQARDLELSGAGSKAETAKAQAAYDEMAKNLLPVDIAARRARAEAIRDEEKALKLSSAATAKASAADKIYTELTEKAMLAERGLAQSHLFGAKVRYSTQGAIGALNKMLMAEIALKQLGSKASDQATAAEARLAAAKAFLTKTVSRENIGNALQSLQQNLIGLMKGGKGGLIKAPEMLAGGFSKLLNTLGPVGVLGAATASVLVIFRNELFGIGAAARAASKAFDEIDKKRGDLNRKQGTDAKLFDLKGKASGVQSVEQIQGLQTDLDALRQSGGLTSGQFSMLSRSLSEVGKEGEVSAAKLQQFKNQLDAVRQGAKGDIEKGFWDSLVDGIKNVPDALGQGLDAVVNTAGAVATGKIFKGVEGIREVAANREADSLLKPLSLLARETEIVGNQSLATAQSAKKLKDGFLLTAEASQSAQQGFKLTAAQLEQESLAYERLREQNQLSLESAEEVAKKQSEVVAKIKDPELKASAQQTLDIYNAEVAKLRERNTLLEQAREASLKYYNETLPALQQAVQLGTRNQEEAIANLDTIFANFAEKKVEGSPFFKDINTLKTEAQTAVEQTMVALDKNFLEPTQVADRLETVLRQSVITVQKNGKELSGSYLGLDEQKQLIQQISEYRNGALREEKGRIDAELESVRQMQQRRVLSSEEAESQIGKLQAESSSKQLASIEEQIKLYKEYGLRTVDLERQAASLRDAIKTQEFEAEEKRQQRQLQKKLGVIEAEIDKTKTAASVRALTSEESESKISQLQVQSSEARLQELNRQIAQYRSNGQEEVSLTQEAEKLKNEIRVQKFEAEEKRQQRQLQKRLGAIDVEVGRVKALAAERGISAEAAEAQIAQLQIRSSETRLQDLNRQIAQYRRNGKEEVSLTQEAEKLKNEIREQKAREADRLYDLQLEKQKRRLQNDLERVKLNEQAKIGAIEAQQKRVEMGQKLAESRNSLQQIQREQSEAQLGNQLKFTNDPQERAAIESQLAAGRLANLAATEAFEQRSLLVQQQMAKLAMQREGIQLGIAKAENQRAIAEAQLELQKAQREKRSQEEIAALNLQLQGLQQQSGLLQEQESQLQDSARQQEEINANAQAELATRQQINRQNAEVEAQLAARQEYFERLEAQKRQLQNDGEAAKLQAQAQNNAIQLAQKELDLSEKLRSSRNQVAQTEAEYAEAQLQNQTKLIGDSQRRAAVEVRVASIRLANLDRTQAAERESLQVQQERERLSLQSEKIQQQISVAENKRAIEALKIDLIKAQTEKRSQTELDALNLQLQGLNQQGQLLEEQSSQIDRAIAQQDELNANAQKELGTRQTIAKQNAEIEIQLAKRQEYFERLEAQRRQLQNDGEAAKLRSQAQTNAIQLAQKELDLTEKIQSSRNQLAQTETEYVEAQLQNQLKLTGDSQQKAAIEARMASERVANLERSQAVERESLELQQERERLSLRTEKIQQQLSIAENKRAIAALKIDLIKAQTEKRSQTEIDAINLQLQGLEQQGKLLGEQASQLDRSAAQQGGLNANARKELEIRQNIAKQNAEIEAQLAKQREYLERLEVQKRQLQNDGEAAKLQSQAQTNAIQLKQKEIELTEKLRSSRNQLAQTEAEFVEAQLQNQAKLTGDPQQKAAIETRIASERLANLARTQAAERESLRLQQEREKLSLQGEKVQQQLSAAENKRAIAALKIDLIKARVEKRSQEEVDALNLQLQGLEQQGQLLDRQTGQLDRTITQQDELNANAQKELDIRQNIARQNAGIELKLAKQREIQAAIEKQLQQVDLSIKAQQVASEARVRTNEQISKVYDLQKQALEAQQNLLNSRTDAVQAELKLAMDVTKSERDKKTLAQATAAIKLRSLQQQQQMELKILEINQLQQRSALESEKIRAKVASAQAVAGVAKARADLAKLEADPQASELQKQAARLEIDAKIQEAIGAQTQEALLGQQGKILDFTQAAERESLLSRQQLASKQARVEFAQSLPGRQSREAMKQLQREIFADAFGGASPLDAMKSLQLAVEQTRSDFFGTPQAMPALTPAQSWQASQAISQLLPTAPQLSVESPKIDIPAQSKNIIVQSESLFDPRTVARSIQDVQRSQESNAKPQTVNARLDVGGIKITVEGGRQDVSQQIQNEVLSGLNQLMTDVKARVKRY